MSGDERHAKKKKIAIVGVSALILVAMVVAVAVGVTQSKKGHDDMKPNTSSKAIEAVCAPTEFKDTCQSSLASKAGNITDPKDLIKIAFEIAKEKINEAAGKSDTLKEIANDKKGNWALVNCKDLLQYAIDDLSRSMAKLGPFDVTKLKEYVADLKVWLSAAVTHEQTCIDGFVSIKSESGDKVREFLKGSMELTRNGLAMVTEVHNLFTQSALKPKRRLMGESNELKAVPSWIDGRKLDLATADVKSLKPDVTVDHKGSGKYKTVNEVIKDIPKNSEKTFIIYIKEGEYKENVVLNKDMSNVMFIGDGPTKTKITGSKSFADGELPMNSATVAVIGDYFIAKDIGFENTAGAKGKQAVALRVQSDMSIFYNCQIDGYQNTLYTQTLRQFYRDCTISGAIDIIFGDAVAVFQNCQLNVKKPEGDESATVTAQQRSDKHQPTAIVLQNCTISGEKDYDKSKNKAFFGRPGHAFARTLVMQSKILDIIDPQGWEEWTGAKYHETCWVGEFSNRGMGSATNKRVTWFKMASREDAEQFTPGKLLMGDRWIKPSGVPCEEGLMKNV